MVTQSPAAGIGPGQTTPKPFSPRDVKAHVMSAGALPRFGNAQAPPESPAGDTLTKTTGEESPQKAVKNFTRIFDNFMGRLRHFLHTIKKAFKQLLGHETPKSPAKHLAKLQMQDLVQLSTQDKRMDETLKRLSTAPGGEILQTPEGRAQIREQVPALLIQGINHALNNDQTRDFMVAGLLAGSAQAEGSDGEEEPAEADLDGAEKPAKPTEETKGRKAEGPSSPDESEAPSSAQGDPLSGLFSLLKNNVGG